MLLALKEIQREKLRYSLIIALIALISYMMFILSALALGLAHLNTSAIEGWHANAIALNEQAEGVMRASMLTQEQVSTIEKHADGETAPLGFTTTRMIAHQTKANSGTKSSINFLGTTANSFVLNNTPLTAGRMPKASHEIALDHTAVAQEHLSLHDKVYLGSDTTAYTIVGIVSDAKMSVIPVAYGVLSDWHTISPIAPSITASAVVATGNFTNTDSSDISTYGIPQFISLLPGYSAQNSTFISMIVVLAIVTLIIIAVFLYIIVLQKLPNIAVLKAQGIPTNYLIRSTLWQGMVVVVAGLIIAILVTAATALATPEVVPMTFSVPLQGATVVGLILMGLFGALLPALQIKKADPITLMQ